MTDLELLLRMRLDCVRFLVMIQLVCLNRSFFRGGRCLLLFPEWTPIWNIRCTGLMCIIAWLRRSVVNLPLDYHRAMWPG